MCALVNVRTAVVGVAVVAIGACAGVVARRINALGTSAAGSRASALVEVCAQNFTITLIAVPTFAEIVRWQIAALGILDATRSYCRILTFVYIFTEKPIAVIAGKAGTREAAKRVDAVRKYVAWTIFAFVFISFTTITTAEAVVTMADAI